MASGAKTDHSQLRRALDQLDAGDVLMVTRLDRLARSPRDLANALATIAGKKVGSGASATHGPTPPPPMCRRDHGGLVKEIARSYAMHHSTISRLIERLRWLRSSASLEKNSPKLNAQFEGTLWANQFRN